MDPIPPELWNAAPKDAAWWMAATAADAYAAYEDYADEDDDACPGHGYADSEGGGDMEYCDGSCITDEPTDADEEPGMIR